MEYLVTAAQMKACDRRTTEIFGISSMVLMERAALACASVLLERDRRLRESGIPAGPGSGRRTLVVAGCGNNGGDGIAVGRLLRQNGFAVTYVLLGNRDACSPETRQQLETEERYGSVFHDQIPDAEYDIIIDALFGIGLSRNLEGRFLQAVRTINQKTAYVLSVDLPSGIHADTGAVMGDAVMADVTVTFAFPKTGCIFYPGAKYAGVLLCRDIGITEESFEDGVPSLFTCKGDPTAWLPPRDPAGNKGSFGKVLLAAGSAGMAGAALLAGEAVLRSGAGMLRLATAEENRRDLLELLPEAMTGPLGQLEEAEAWADVLAAGPGLGTGADAAEAVRWLLLESRKPLVLDADGLNLLSADPELLEALVCRQEHTETRRPLILTPHPGELGRLVSLPAAQIAADPIPVVRSLSAKLHAVVLCKGARTVVSREDGRCYVNTSGCSGMATAGSGDVLTGILASLLAAGMDPFAAACLGVYVHGLAGERAAHQKGSCGMLAGDITAQLGAVLG